MANFREPSRASVAAAETRPSSDKGGSAVIPVVGRVCIALACAFVLWRAIPLAIADYYASRGTEQGYERAIAIEPGNGDPISAHAVFLAVSGDPSPAVDQALRTAVAMNPADAEALMALGLRAEYRGDTAEAQSALERAASVSHLFKPAWTLSGFYFRTGRHALFWPMIERCLDLIEPKSIAPVSFDPAPVFDLAWREDPDPVKIRAVVPRRAETLIPYLRWLYSTGRIDPALALWPDALAVAGADVSMGFVEHLLAAGRVPEAVSVWNDAVRRGLVQSAPLDPAAGNSVENPEFVVPLTGRGFSWRLLRETGVFVTRQPHALRFELTGGEPESFELLWKFVPVAPGRHWRLVWDADISRLENPRGGSGLSFTIDERPGISAHACPPVDRMAGGECEFTTLPSTGILRLSLRYQRPAGSTRLKGAVVFSAVHLEPAP